jgi:hypothetical protein
MLIAAVLLVAASVECPCAGRPLSGEERTVGYHNDANQTVGVIGAGPGLDDGDCET